MINSQREFMYGDKKIPYSVERVDRETIGIVVEPTGEVIVRAPVDLTETKITEAVVKKRKWIVEKIHQTTLVKQPIPKNREPISGEKIVYKNKLYRIKIHLQNKRRNKITFVGGILHIYIDEQLPEIEKKYKIKEIIITWYKKRAKKMITDRVKRFSILIDKKPISIHIRETKIRWGSCTPDGKLNFNWRIIMAPISAIDYIVIHELCHLKEPKHTPQFWHLIESIMPEYEKWKEWLHVNGLLLDLRM